MEELIMAYERNPNDPYRGASDPYRPSMPDDNLRNAASLDNEMQPDPELSEGRASGGRVAMFAVAAALILGAVFYGLNNTTINQAGTSSTAQNAQNTAQTSPPAAPPGMRDVTPGPNSAPGVTTGAAPARPQAPPSAAPTGQDMNRAGNPPSDTTPPASK
jgi:cell division protein FtsN